MFITIKSERSVYMEKLEYNVNVLLAIKEILKNYKYIKVVSEEYEDIEEFKRKLLLFRKGFSPFKTVVDYPPLYYVLDKIITGSPIEKDNFYTLYLKNSREEDLYTFLDKKMNDINFEELNSLHDKALESIRVVEQAKTGLFRRKTKNKKID